MPERTGRLSVGMGRRHPVTMHKASLRTLSMRRVCALRHQAGAQYSAVEEISDKSTVRNVLAQVPYPEPASRLSSEMHVDSFLHNALMVMTIGERSVQFHTKIGRHGQNSKILPLFLAFSSRLASRLWR